MLMKETEKGWEEREGDESSHWMTSRKRKDTAN
jgi:hypothetical protein